MKRGLLVETQCIAPLQTFIIFIITACMLFFFLPLARKFIILNYNTKQILYLSNVKPGDTFSIIYTHSVNRSPIEDQFVVDSEYNIVLLKSIFKSFGAGVPSTSDNEMKFEFFEDRIEASYTNRKIEKLILSIGTIADHRFIMNEKNIRLSELSEPQSSIYFSIDRITLFQLVKHTITIK